MEDERGLKVEIDPPDTQDARDLIKKMQRGDIDQMSFAFTMEGGIQTWDETGKMPLRTIDKIGELWDVSVVTYPAYPDTEAAARSLAAVRKERQRQNFNNAAARLKRKAMQDHKFRSI
jgi:HK97 family phage prohead protease